MSKINPLYILALCVMLFVASFMLLNKKKEALQTLKHTHSQKLILGKEFQYFKRKYHTKVQIQQQIKALKNITSFKSEQLRITENQKSIKIIFESKNSTILHRFLNHVLKEPFSFKTFNVSLNKVSFEVEI